MWLMERLGLISPPEDIENYTPTCFVRRKKRIPKIRRHGWRKVFESRDFAIKWVIPWWKIERMVGVNKQPFCRLPSLSRVTYYYPCRVKRQYGLLRNIPSGDLRPPYEYPVSQEVDRFDTYWRARPLWKVITQKVPPSLPNDVKKWLLKKSSIDQGRTDVKNRLGDRVTPAKERLGARIEFKTPIMPRKKNTTRDKGKGKLTPWKKRLGWKRSMGC